MLAEPALISLYGLAGTNELVFGLLLLLFLFTRWDPFILSGERAMAYFIGQAGGKLLPVAQPG